MVGYILCYEFYKKNFKKIDNFLKFYLMCQRNNMKAFKV